MNQSSYRKPNKMVAHILSSAQLLSAEQAEQLEVSAPLLMEASDFLNFVAHQCGVVAVRRTMDFYRKHLGYYRHIQSHIAEQAVELDCRNGFLRLVNSMSDGTLSGVQLEVLWDDYAKRYYTVESKLTTVNGALARTVVHKEFLTSNL